MDFSALERTAFAALDALAPAGALGLAVSGGGDSTAMMLLAHDWAAARGRRIEIACVDHGLRAESAAEAAGVMVRARALGHDVETLRWLEWDGRGNMQAAARAARRRLLSDWAKRRGLAAVALAHTMEDQAETVLMRLARGAGVDGLSAMAARTEGEGIVWLRPLLDARRADLRAWLAARGETWVDDPTNDDPRYDRIRARRALAGLGELGLDSPTLAGVAARMGEAREALDAGAADLATRAARWGLCGELRLDLGQLRAAPVELSRRLLRAGLTRVAGAEYGPRGEAEGHLLTAMLGLKLGGGRSLHGCLIRPDGPTGAVISREVAAVDPAPLSLNADGALWDNRFRIQPCAPLDDAHVAPLGEAGARRLKQLAETGAWRAPDGWRAAPRSAQLATPALWRREALTSAPVAGYGDALTAEFAPRGGDWPLFQSPHGD